MASVLQRHSVARRVARAVLAIGATAIAVGCGGSEQPIFVDDVVEPATTTTTILVVPATTAAPPVVEPVEIARAWSPENATAEIIGTGAASTDPVTVDDVLVTPESFTVDADGEFTVRVTIADEGAHTVCVRDVCSRVYTLAPDAETSAEVEAKIAEARPLAAAIFDGESLFPEWSIDVAGPFSGTGGSTDVDSKTITVYANRGRTVDEYVVTILHEWGHVVDAERMTADERVAYLEARGVDPATPWRSPGTHRLDTWGDQPSEDFAEVLVALWTADTETPHIPRTLVDAGAPDQALFDQVTALVTD
jgi:hypothetical protein